MSAPANRGLSTRQQAAQDDIACFPPVGMPANRRFSVSSTFAMRFIEIYRTRVAPGLDVQCRFDPSCSQYALDAYRTFGFMKATRKTLGRLSRCRKGYKGSLIDPVSAEEEIKAW